MTQEEWVISYDALYESMMKCKNGVMWKDSVAHFVLNAPEEIMKLERELNSGTYVPRPPKVFEITSPKRREISSVSFRDRVYQRSLNDNILYPTMTRSFIYDNWACQVGKGTDGARERLKEFLRSFYRKHGLNGYIAKFDIKGYYPNMSHRYVENMFRAKLSDEAYRMVEGVLHHQYGGDKGYNPGSQMIQIAGISALDKLDHFIKEQLHIRYYLRYMDDFILIHENRAYLEECRTKIEEKLAECPFELHKDKSWIRPVNSSIRFLGFDFRLTESGKVLMLISPENVKAKRKNLRRLVEKSKAGYLPKESVDESYRCWRVHAEKGTNHALIQRMDKYYKELWYANL